MYPSLPFGPLSLPTTPIMAILAAMVGLELASRYGRRLGLAADDVWNAGLLALLAGLIVARLWNVVQFWTIYADEPRLIISLRPSGYAFWPGVVGGLVAGYGYLLWRALDPLPMAAAFSVGGLGMAAILSVSAYLTGGVLGTPSDAAWALPYYRETLHPVGLYRAAGFGIALAWIWMMGDVTRPGRVVLQVILGYSVVRLVADAFVAEAALMGSLRTSQMIAFAVALASSLALALTAREKGGEPTPDSNSVAP